MSAGKKKKKKKEAAELEPGNVDGEEGSVDEGDGRRSEKDADVEDLRTRAGERDEYYELMLRARADLENFSKRIEKGREQWRKIALKDFVSDLLPALDTLHAAVRHPEEMNADSLLDGIRLMEKQIAEIFQRNGIDVIDPDPGDEFDPALHGAVVGEPSDEFEPGRITAVMRRGFKVSEMLVRAAEVRVAAEKSGGPEEHNGTGGAENRKEISS